MAKKKTDTVHFSIEGAFVTQHFRGLMIEGKEGEAFKQFSLSMINMPGFYINTILEGNAHLIGVNDLEYVVEEDKAYKKKLEGARAYKKKKDDQKVQEHLDMLDKLYKTSEENIELREFKTDIDEYADELNAELEAETTKEKQPLFTDKLDRYLDSLKTEYPKKPEALDRHGLDGAHQTWWIDPKGNYYKVPWMKHTELLEQYPKFGFEDQHEALKAGWIRISAGLGDGHVMVDAEEKSTKEALSALRIFVMRYGAYKFGFGLEFELDYKEMQRALNEKFKK